MSETVVRVDNLGKKYLLGHRRSDNLRQTFKDSVRWMLGGSDAKDEFWALKDLNFEIKQGDVVGIVGRNGAGKSTLLKILSRITHPTTGRFEMEGRVSSLLEVGTGFHMELTGRENIFLNGTILGMRRHEIKARFDDIVSFSGIEDFLETPVKHYSSGMRVRLAFSVAAHLEPETLIVDEVLAVGDAEFQKKCLGKMGEVSKKDGRTILFVSHNMAAVEHLCNTAMMLSGGRLVDYGDVSSVIKNYLESCEAETSNAELRVTEGLSVQSFFLDEDVECMDDVNYEIRLSNKRINRINELAILIFNDLHERVGIVDLRRHDLQLISSTKKEITIKGRIKCIPLIEGTYHLGLFVSSNFFTGDLLDLRRWVINPRHAAYVPYARKHRGHVQFQTDYIVE